MVAENFTETRYGLVVDPLIILDRIFGNDEVDPMTELKTLARVSVEAQHRNGSGGVRHNISEPLSAEDLPRRPTHDYDMRPKHVTSQQAVQTFKMEDRRRRSPQLHHQTDESRLAS